MTSALWFDEPEAKKTYSIDDEDEEEDEDEGELPLTPFLQLKIFHVEMESERVFSYPPFSHETKQFMISQTVNRE